MATSTTADVRTLASGRVPPAARVSTGAAASFLILLALLHVLKPDFDPSWRMISEYEIGAHGWVMQAAFFALALSAVSLAVALRTHARTRAGRIGRVLLLVSAAGMVIGGLFTSDPTNAGPGELTTHGMLHGVGAMLGIPAMAASALLVGRSLIRNPTWSPMRRTQAWASLAPLLALIVFLASTAVLMPASGGKFGPDLPIGVQNRLFMVATAGWYLLTARQILSIHRTHH